MQCFIRIISLAVTAMILNGCEASKTSSTPPTERKAKAPTELPPNVTLDKKPPRLGETQSFDVEIPRETGILPDWVKLTAASGWIFDKLTTSNTPKKVGTVKWSDTVYSGRILTTSKLYEDFTRQYGSDFDVQLIKMPVSWFPEKTEEFDFSEAIKTLELEILFEKDSDGNNPVIQDIFPKTSFKDEGYKVSGRIGVGTEGFQRAGIDTTGIDANIGASFEYTPLVAKIISDGLGNQATFRIKEVNDRQPVGQIDYYCTVLVPRKMRKANAKLTVKLWFDEKEYIELPSQTVLVEFGSQ